MTQCPGHDLARDTRALDCSLGLTSALPGRFQAVLGPGPGSDPAAARSRALGLVEVPPRVAPYAPGCGPAQAPRWARCTIGELAAGGGGAAAARCRSCLL
jgi:hypothetical protein